LFDSILKIISIFQEHIINPSNLIASKNGNFLIFMFYGEFSRNQKILHSQQTFKVCFHPMIWII
jgi:hypothetical protein